MKITLAFDDSKDDGNFEILKAKRALNADDAFYVLSTIEEYLRQWGRYTSDISDRELKKIDELRSLIAESGLMEMYL